MVKRKKISQVSKCIRRINKILIKMDWNIDTFKSIINFESPFEIGNFN